MKKRMLTGLFLILVMSFIVMLSGCGGKTGICDNCYQEKTVKEYEATIFGGTETALFCDECAEEVEALGVHLEKK